MNSIQKDNLEIAVDINIVTSKGKLQCSIETIKIKRVQKIKFQKRVIPTLLKKVCFQQFLEHRYSK